MLLNKDKTIQDSFRQISNGFLVSVTLDNKTYEGQAPNKKAAKVSVNLHCKDWYG